MFDALSSLFEWLTQANPPVLISVAIILLVLLILAVWAITNFLLQLRPPGKHVMAKDKSIAAGRDIIITKTPNETRKRKK